MLAPGRAKPKPTPETRHFWDGTKDGSCCCSAAAIPGRRISRRVPSAPIPAPATSTVFEASGRATLHSYVIHHRPVPGFTPPYAIAVVELEEGPRMMTNIVDCAQTPEALVLDMPLRGRLHADGRGNHAAPVPSRAREASDARSR